MIYGISFRPPGCETVNLCFLSNGRMSSTLHLKFYGDATNTTTQKYLYSLSVKTQYAGIEVHLLLMRLFKYLATKYLSDFWLMDEGGFWGVEDEAVHQQNFNKYNFLIDSFTEAITTRQKKPGESLTQYFSRLLTEIREKGKDK